MEANATCSTIDSKRYEPPSTLGGNPSASLGHRRILLPLLWGATEDEFKPSFKNQRRQMVVLKLHPLRKQNVQAHFLDQLPAPTPQN